MMSASIVSESSHRDRRLEAKTHFVLSSQGRLTHTIGIGFDFVLANQRFQTAFFIALPELWEPFSYRDSTVGAGLKDLPFS